MTSSKGCEKLVFCRLNFADEYNLVVVSPPILAQPVSIYLAAVQTVHDLFEEIHASKVLI